MSFGRISQNAEANIEMRFTGHKEDILCILWFKELQKFASCSYDGKILVWELENPSKEPHSLKVYEEEEVKEKKNHSINHILKLNEEILVSISDNGIVRSYSMKSLQKIKKDFIFEESKHMCLRMSKMFTGVGKEKEKEKEEEEEEEEEEIIGILLQGNQEIAIFTFSNHKVKKFVEGEKVGFKIGYFTEIVSSKIHPNSIYINEGDKLDPKVNEIKILDYENEKVLKSFNKHNIEIFTIVVVCNDTDNGEKVFCAGRNGILFIYNSDLDDESSGGDLVKKMEVAPWAFCSISLLLKNNNLILIGDSQGFFRIVDLEKETTMVIEKIHDDSIYSMKVISEGKSFIKILSCGKFNNFTIFLTQISL